MDKPEQQEDGGGRSVTPARAKEEAESYAEAPPAELRVSQEDIEATARQSQKVLQASSELLANLDVSGGQLEGVTQALEREVERARGLLKSGNLSPEAARQVTALLEEVLPEWFVQQGGVRMATLAVVGDGEGAAVRTTSSAHKPGRAPRRRGRTAV